MNEAFRAAAVTAVGAALPSMSVPTSEVAARLGVEPDWIVKRTGIQHRYRAGPGERLTDVAASASLMALERADLRPRELDLVLVATMTPDELTPHAAPLVAGAIGADHAGAMDIGAACTAFLSALAVAVGQIEAGRARTALVVGADFMSRIVDPDDRTTAGIFGDGSGAVVVQSVSGPPRFGPFVLRADGAAGKAIVAPRPAGPVRMDGQTTFRRAVASLAEASRQALALAGATLDEIDLAVYHQANSRITQRVAEELGLPNERVVDCIAEYGNTTAATLPIALNHAHRSGKLREGTRVLLGAFGAGLTWGATVLTWSGAE
jgi:3-oxoacyl-[acyl-carrier-protein] synthase III